MIICILSLFALFSAVSCFSAERFPWLNGSDNFHVVEEGKLYRSAQLSQETLEKCIDYYKINMVINLRHRAENKKSFDAEKKVCEQKKIFFLNIPMQHDDIPSVEQIELLLGAYRFALCFNFVVLIHCYAGRDRTGLASALWLFERQGCYCDDVRKIALKQFDMKYGLFPEPIKIFFIKMWQGEESFKSRNNKQFYDQYQSIQKRYQKAFVCCDFFCDCGDCGGPSCFCESRYWINDWVDPYVPHDLCKEMEQLKMT